MLEATRHSSYVKALKDEILNNKIQARTAIEQIDEYGKVQLPPSYSTRAYDAIMGEGLLIVIDPKSTDELFNIYTRIDEWKETSAIINSQTEESIRNNIYKIHAGSIVRDSELVEDGFGTKYFAESFGNLFLWLSISTLALLCFLAVGFFRLFIFNKSKSLTAKHYRRHNKATSVPEAKISH